MMQLRFTLWVERFCLYMQKKEDPMIKLAKVISICLAVALLGLAAGCQPNPTTPPVVNKGDLENKIKDKTAEPAVTGASSATAGAAAVATAEPKNYKASYENGKLRVDVDAVLTLPPVDKLPVVKVQPGKFTQDNVDAFLRVLFQGKPAYLPKSQMTKDELNRELIRMKAMKAQAKEGDKTLEKINAVIAHYEEQLKTAPDKVDMVPSDGKLKTDELGGQEIYVIAQLGKSSDANLSVYNSKSGRTSSLWFTNEEQGESYMGFEAAANGAPKGVSMSMEDARALAEKTVSDMGSDLKLAWSGIGVNRMKSDKTGTFTEGGQAWLFAFTRTVNGVPMVYDSDIGANLPEEEIERANRSKDEFIEPHPYERIVMAINDTGIVELQWSSPDKLIETVSENAETISFEQAMETFQKQFFIHNALKSKTGSKNDGWEQPGDYAKMLRDIGIYNAESIGYAEDVKSCTFKINRVVLGLTRIAVKDKENEFLIVPVYDFFGSLAVEYTPESGFEGFSAEIVNHSFLTINAIDGSIINRSYGY